MGTNRDRVLGINGLGRIGKLTLWHHVSRKHFREIVVNLGRRAGSSLNDVADYLERDSTYGSLGQYLHGSRTGEVISHVDDGAGTMVVDDVKITVLRQSRNPAEINWGKRGADLVVDTTGQFLDPTHEAARSGGALRGHLDAGARRVIVSAPFKIKDAARGMPDDAITAIMGINDSAFDPARHRIVSAASCTTTCLAHMMKPLLDALGAGRILAASMATIHAATGTQQVLDRLPKEGAKDLRKNRSILDNIILTTTGAAETLALVLPAMKQIGFMAESVRIPVPTGSLIILVVTIQEDPEGAAINRELINDIYRRTAVRDNRGYLVFSDRQSVSGDMVGRPTAAAIIEGHETHTRTAEVSFDLTRVRGLCRESLERIGETSLSIPITQAVVYGWYDNELGGYVHMLGELAVMIAGQ